MPGRIVTYAHRYKRTALGVILCATLAIAWAALAAGVFDGTYQGTQRGIRTHQDYCLNLDLDNITLVVRNDHFSKGWGPGVRLQLDVAADGSFYASVPNPGTGRLIEMKGSICGDSLEADVGTSFCAAHLSLKRS
jgi:hypothetical protein